MMSLDPESARPFKLGMLPQDLKTLGDNSIFKRLGAHDLGPFLDILDEVAVAPGAVVVDPSSDDAYMYFILQGEAVVLRDALVVRRLGPGDHFGELSVLGMRARTASVVAEGVMRLARLSRRRFQSMASRHPAAALRTLEGVIACLGNNVVDLAQSLANAPERRRSKLPLELRMNVDGIERVGTTGTPLSAIVPKRKDDEIVLLAAVDNKPLPLHAPLVSSGSVAALTVRHLAGREAWQRSVQLLLLEAVHRVAPTLEVWTEAPFEGMSVVSAREASSLDVAKLAGSIEEIMIQIATDDVAFVDDAMTVDEARAMLLRQGWASAAALQSTSRESVTTLGSCGSVYAPSVGPFVPSTGTLTGFRVLAHPRGLLLDCGAKTRPDTQPVEHEAAIARELSGPRFFSEMALAHRAFLASMGVTTIGEFNDLCVRGDVGRLIRVSEAFHEKWIGRIADGIAADRKSLRVIAIAGPSSSGKTTFIRRLSVQLEVSGVHPVYLSLDDYYVDRVRTPRDETGEYDFEAVDALDIPLVRSHLRGLVAGERVRTPRYDFKSGKSIAEGGEALAIGPNDILLVEGIHALNDDVWDDAVLPSARRRVFVHPSTTLALDPLNGVSSADARLLRRIVRDRHQRGVAAAENIRRWDSVLRGERRHIYPGFGNADTVFDTSLAYEPAILKVYAERYLLEVSQDDAAFPAARRLRQLVEPVVAIHPDHVPPTSLLREFIGGSGFEPAR